LVSPASIFDPLDPFTTGVVYMPIGLAYGASSLRGNGYTLDLLDLFGKEPTSVNRIGNYIRLGAPNSLVVERIRIVEPDIVFFYANQVLNHDSLIETMSYTRNFFPDILIAVIENTQAVTSYSLVEVLDDFFSNGADFIISGEMEKRILEVMGLISKKVPLDSWNIDGVSTKYKVNTPSLKMVSLDELDIPAWDLFPIENYWKLGYAHGPFTTKSYFPILTSRGCPFPCKFCVVPSTNDRKWRSRSAENVVDEIEFLHKTYNVAEFHLEDLNPTIQDLRMREISQEILKRNLIVTWKIVAGTKVETIKTIDTLQLMHKSGLSYLSISPESGSKELLKEIGKPFNVNHALKIVSESYKLGIRTQACFVLGYPSEKLRDKIKSLSLVAKLTIKGVDEIVVFIMAPIPGSEVYKSYKGKFSSYSSLSFSPRWRSDYKLLILWRVFFYSTFLGLKFFKNPFRMFKQIENLITGKFETKMEMTPVRGLKYLILIIKNKKFTQNKNLQVNLL
jgi:radical SAM superfamily enzyme YgiQ (UPF0313 family)